jgi:hypothetical protein
MSRPQHHGLSADFIAKSLLETERIEPETFFFTTICLAFGFSLSGPCCVLGLTAYLLNVKVFV